MNGIAKISDYYIKGKVDRLHRLEDYIRPLFYIRHCKIKMLIVTDFGADYGTSNFGLLSFLKAFDEPLPYTSFEITKAHRRNDTNADIEDFKFDAHDLSQYDVIFLFGVERPAFRPPAGANLVDDSELRAISEYMDNGGGIFATGDHEDLGVDMCGKIPRIRSMRRWWTAANPGPNGEPFAPAQGGGNNLDTVVDTDTVTPGLQGSQSDLVPQTIYPIYRYGFASAGYSSSLLYRYVKYPHPVLCSPDGVIKVLPDHMHEGLCEVPSDLTMSFNFDGYSITEYPMVSGARLRPEVIARATNHVTDTKFGVIATLDGHKHDDIGRVLVDATWHHFFNINIGQFQSLKELVDGGRYTPTAAEVVALNQYNFIQHYFRNIAYWLAGKNKQTCFRNRGIRWLLNHNDVKMNLIFDVERLNRFDRIQYFYTVGTLAKNALGDLQSECQSSGLSIIYDVIFPVKRSTTMIRKENFSFIDPQIFEAVCLGCSLHDLNLKLRASKDDMNDKEVEKILTHSTYESAMILMDEISSNVSTLKRRLRKQVKG